MRCGLQASTVWIRRVGSSNDRSMLLCVRTEACHRLIADIQEAMQAIRKVIGEVPILTAEQVCIWV